MNLSQNFTLQELIHSDTANAYKINNTPSEPVINNVNYSQLKQGASYAISSNEDRISRLSWSFQPFIIFIPSFPNSSHCLKAGDFFGY